MVTPITILIYDHKENIIDERKFRSLKAFAIWKEMKVDQYKFVWDIGENYWYAYPKVNYPMYPWWCC